MLIGVGSVRQLTSNIPFAACTCNQVKVAWHQHKGSDFEPFVLLAKAEAVEHDAGKRLSGEKINPLDDGEGEKIQPVLIQYLVAHSMFVACSGKAAAFAGFAREARHDLRTVRAEPVAKVRLRAKLATSMPFFDGQGVR